MMNFIVGWLEQLMQNIFDSLLLGVDRIARWVLFRWQQWWFVPCGNKFYNIVDFFSAESLLDGQCLINVRENLMRREEQFVSKQRSLKEDLSTETCLHKFNV